MIDETSTTVNIARMLLMGLDSSRVETPVQTEVLRRILEAVIDWGQPAKNMEMDMTARRTIMGHVVAVEEAEKARDGKGL